MLCNCTQVRDVCPNCEVVIFQPQTATLPNLGPITIATNFISIPPELPEYTVFMDFYFTSYILSPTHQQPFIIVSLSMFAPSTHLLYWRKELPTWTSPGPGTRHPLTLVSDPCDACLRFPLCSVNVRPPLCFHQLDPRFLLAPGGFDRCRSIRLPFESASPSLSAPLSPGIIWCLVSILGDFSHEGEGPGHLHSLSVSSPGPHSSHYLAMPAPFRLPGSPLPPSPPPPYRTCSRSEEHVL